MHPNEFDFQYFEIKNKSFPSLEQKKLLNDHSTSNSDLNSNYFLKYKSLEGAEEENLNFGDKHRFLITIL